MNIRVLLVDDHTIFREALRLMLEKSPGIEVVGEAADGAAVEAEVARTTPDVVVMDVSMPSVNGIDATRALRDRFPAVQVIALSAYGYKRFVLEMLEAGALGYVVKSAASEELVRAIASAAQGKTYICSEAAATLAEASRRGRPGAEGARPENRLARRELQVLRLLAAGKSSPQIAEELHIAPSTADVHRRNIMRKLEMHSVAELTRYAIRIGLTET